jgi:hypothetical protein
MRLRTIFGAPGGIVYGIAGSGDPLWFKSSAFAGVFSWRHWLDNAQSPALSPPAQRAPADKLASLRRISRGPLL